MRKLVRQFECGCITAEVIRGHNNTPLCPKHLKSFKAFVIPCRICGKETFHRNPNGRYCKICKRIAYKFHNKKNTLRTEISVPPKEEKKNKLRYIWTCGCVTTYPHHYDKGPICCPNCDTPTFSHYEITCVICGKVQVAKSASTQKCDACKPVVVKKKVRLDGFRREPNCKHREKCLDDPKKLFRHTEEGLNCYGCNKFEDINDEAINHLRYVSDGGLEECALGYL